MFMRWLVKLPTENLSRKTVQRAERVNQLNRFNACEDNE
jgi:hypothetical protein